MNEQLEINQIMASIALGYDCEAFIQSSLGKFLIERAQGEALEAMTELKQVDVSDSKRIAHLQNMIARAEGFESWLIEGLQLGKASEEQLRLANAEE